MLKRYMLSIFFDQSLKNKFFIFLSGIVMILAGCLEVEVVHQPHGVPQGASFHSDVMVEFRKHPDIGTDDDRGMLFAVMKPEAWTIDSITYMSPEYGDGIFSYLGNAVDEDEEGGIMEGWQDSLEQDFPSPAGMHWQMYLSDQDTTSTSTEADPDSFHVMVHYTVDNTLATYDLYYYTTHTNNNDHTDASKFDWDDATTTVFDPAASVNVTLQVDMSDQTVSEAGVHVAGSFQGWDPAGTPLSDDDGDGVWSVTLDMAGVTDPVVFYKFLNGNSWGTDETVSDPECGGAGGFQSDRFLHRPFSDLTLDPVCFHECIGCDESYVHFQVDMSETPVAENGIHLGGGQWHNNYIEMHPRHHGPMENPNIFEVKVVVPEDSSFYYKFNNGANDSGYEDGENLTLEGCGDSLSWGDRSVQVGSDDVMLPPVCFSSCYACGNAPVTANVTFQADMSVLLSQGWDINTNFMEIRGGMNGWTAGDTLEQDLLDPNLFTITKEIFAQEGSMHEWKFKANPDADFNNNGWETAPNRHFYFWGNDIVLEPVAPVILPVGPLANDVTIEIHATWMEGTVNANSGEAFPQKPDTLIMNGSFLNCWCTWGNCMGSTCTEPVSPDVPRLTDADGDSIYTGTLSLAAGHGNVFTYKLGAYYPGIEEVPGENGAMDNEAGFGADKTFYIPTDASGTVALETVFGDNNPMNPFLPRTITLNLDMRDHEPSEDGVHVAGSFQGWDPAATELLDPDRDGIFSVDIHANAGDTIYYKFINGNAWGSDEGVEDLACGGAGGFGSDRWLEVPDMNTSLAPVCFRECISCEESYVTFHVDMAEVETISPNGVFLGGGIWHDNWEPMMLVEDSLYMVKVTLHEGESYYYKFNNGGDGSLYEPTEDLVADGCGDPDSWGDRSVMVGDDNMMLPPVCFSSCYACGMDPVEASITFQADMSTLLSQGWDNSVHTMELRGGVNGWAGGDVFMEDLTDPNLYTITKTAMAAPGTMHEWKFKANPDANFNNNGWETVANRVFEFTGEDMVLDAATPVILPLGELANDVTIQIHATWNMNTMNVNTGEPFAQAPDTIIVNGSFLNCWCTWGDCMGSTCATSVSPDVPRLTDPDGNGVYAGTLTLPAGHGNVFTYKLGAYYPGIENETGPNGAMDNEAGFGADKTFYMDTDASGTVVMETVFGDNNPDNPWAHPGGYLVNGGFEEGPAGWGSWPPELENWEVTDVVAADGMHSLKISPRTDDSDANPQWTPVYQSFTAEGLNLVPGNYMHMEGHLMAHSSNPITGNNNSYLFIEFFDAGWSQLAKYTSDVVDASSTMDVWHHMAVSGAVPEGTININAGCELWQGTDVDAGDAYFDNVSMNVSTLSTEDEEIIAPTKFALLGNYPNPFNPVTTLRFDLDYTSNVNVTIFNILGNEVITLQNGQLNPGRHSLQWNALNRHGQRVPSGLYLYKVVSDARVLTGKMLLMKQIKTTSREKTGGRFSNSPLNYKPQKI